MDGIQTPLERTEAAQNHDRRKEDSYEYRIKQKLKLVLYCASTLGTLCGMGLAGFYFVGDIKYTTKEEHKVSTTRINACEMNEAVIKSMLESYKDRFDRQDQKLDDMAKTQIEILRKIK